jgi:hypothetical protein
MTLTQPLYANFLESKSVYSLNAHYWSRLLQRVTNAKKMSVQNNVLTTTFNNGRPFFDGNPIFDALIDNKKAIRIIQEQPDSSELNINAWVEETEIHGHTVEELVINLELTKESQVIAKKLLEYWLVDDCSKQKMNLYIEEEV